ncbi:MAG: hypothetical protein [Circular genetic element sp.]|nr:MAG: hypothetical protein [Circular genetic element sp.]
MSDTFTVFDTEYEDSPMGAFQFQLDLLNPFDTDARWMALRVGYGTAISYGGYALTSMVTGTPMPGFWTRAINTAFMKGNQIRTGVTLGARYGPTLGMGLFAHESIAALATNDVERHPAGWMINPVIEQWMGHLQQRGEARTGKGFFEYYS